MPRRHAIFAILLCPLPLPSEAEDLIKGEGVFQNRCIECHALDGETVKIGPPLSGLFGRPSGTWPGYAYSDAMKAANILWGRETLAEYLRNPRAMVPGTKMNFNGLKRAGEEAALIAYLEVATVSE